MNEPSVFNGPENTMSKDNLHFLSNKKSVQHKDVHNAYGRMMIQATYQGLIER
jgi:alpha 1,3-glucosidase